MQGNAIPLKEALKDVLTEEELEKAPSTYDIIGDIGVVEIPEELEDRKQEIGEALLESQGRIETVLRKGRSRGGKYRTRDYEYLAGEEKTETVHTESGCRFRLDLEKCYFSARESTERLRVAEEVEDGENVLVMFAGIGPYALVIARKKDVNVTAVEWNPDACYYMAENVRLNKLMDKVKPLCSDVEEIVPDLGEFDRVVMPLPQNSEEYLDVAVGALKEGGVLHMYTIQPEEDPWERPEKWLTAEAEEQRRTAEITGQRELLSYSPGMVKVCVTARIT